MIRLSILALTALLSVNAFAAWPTDNITTTHLDASADDPSQARAEIYNALLRLKDVISSSAAAARANLGAAASGANGDITSLIGLTGPVSSTRACAAGYTRISPNYCKRDDASATTPLVDSTPTTIGAPSSNAVAVDIYTVASVSTGNSVGARYVDIDAYTTSGCTVVKDHLASTRSYEQVATTAGQILTKDTQINTVAVDGSKNIYLKSVKSGNANTAYVIIGYHD